MLSYALCPGWDAKQENLKVHRKDDFCKIIQRIYEHKGFCSGALRTEACMAVTEFYEHFSSEAWFLRLMVVQLPEYMEDVLRVVNEGSYPNGEEHCWTDFRNLFSTEGETA